MNNVPIDEEPDDEDQEDQTAQNDFNIEQVVIDFIDEPCIRHDVIPDSDSDEDDDVQRGRDRNEIIRGDGNLYMDQVFYNKIAFKEAVLDYALRLGRNIRQCRYDKTKLGYRCNVDVCGWRIYCSVSSKSDKWQVTRFIEKHSCTLMGSVSLLECQ